MKKLKHNKLRNTGLIFEILTRNLMVETLNGKPPHSISIIKRHFTANSELSKELKLYEGLTHNRKEYAKQLIEATLASRRKLDPRKLESEKYELVKSLKRVYDLNEFFSTRVPNYKVHASVFKIFEFNEIDNPEEYINTKTLVLENLTGVKEEIKSEYEELLHEDPDILRLGFKMIVEKFNNKYSNLNINQKNLLSMYINGDPESEDFKSFFYKEVGQVNRSLDEIKNGIEDGVLKIKLLESKQLLQDIVKSPHIRDEHLDAMLKYYELIEVLENG